MNTGSCAVSCQACRAHSSRLCHPVPRRRPPPQADKGDPLQTGLGGYGTPVGTAASGGTAISAGAAAGATAGAPAPTKIKLKVKLGGIGGGGGGTKVCGPAQRESGHPSICPSSCSCLEG